ncbi:uncharacterized protein B0I36DRAFT_24115 [Microdochium trichocladiopsis]|uniref:Uncharacterized protein n=1 Tax=Microdochium trichocladiopsis TaxID=1682393 RepID=A0A9P8YM51_9PEZI|nr:uncharacterized protein B0I36DRAFT_24115 [Microdochium trichocladiopsis]KAH7041530.1 hypothetical protein B0I36DRAFT_24115 [Microdochium trichocladiopsis]
MVQYPQLHHGHNGEVWPPQQVGGSGHDLAGRIMWLPPAPNSLDSGSKYYDHPVVVLSAQARDGKVDFFVMTSLGKTDLIKKFPNDAQLRKHYLPIKPAHEHPDNEMVLELSNPTDVLDLRTYVNTRTVRSASLGELRDYRTKPQRSLWLSKQSYRQLVTHAGYVPVITAGLNPVETGTAMMTTTTTVAGIREEELLRAYVARYGYGVSSPRTSYAAVANMRPATLPVLHGYGGALRGSRSVMDAVTSEAITSGPRAWMMPPPLHAMSSPQAGQALNAPLGGSMLPRQNLLQLQQPRSQRLVHPTNGEHAPLLPTYNVYMGPPRPNSSPRQSLSSTAQVRQGRTSPWGQTLGYVFLYLVLVTLLFAVLFDMCLLVIEIIRVITSAGDWTIGGIESIFTAAAEFFTNVREGLAEILRAIGGLLQQARKLVGDIVHWLSQLLDGST